MARYDEKADIILLDQKVTQPVGDNNTDYGKQQNRRVEIAIFANDKLKKAAESGALKEK